MKPALSKAFLPFFPAPARILFLAALLAAAALSSTPARGSSPSGGLFDKGRAAVTGGGGHTFTLNLVTKLGGPGSPNAALYHRYGMGGADLGLPVTLGDTTFFCFGDPAPESGGGVVINNCLAYRKNFDPGKDVRFNDFWNDNSELRLVIEKRGLDELLNPFFGLYPSSAFSSSGAPRPFVAYYYQGVNWLALRPVKAGVVILTSPASPGKRFDLWGENSVFLHLCCARDPFGSGTSSDTLYIVGTGNLPGHGLLNDYFLGRTTVGEAHRAGSYTYWDGTGWNPDEARAVPVIDEINVAEGSLVYDGYIGEWILIYDKPFDGIYLRTSPDLVAWSTPVLLAKTIPGTRVLYGPFFYHDERFVVQGGKELYFNLSEFIDYNVFLVKMTVSP